MSVSVVKAEKWLPVSQLKIKITDSTTTGVQFRILAAVKVNGKEIEYDLFSLNPDFFVGNKGVCTLMPDGCFKIKAKFEII